MIRLLNLVTLSEARIITRRYHKHIKKRKETFSKLATVNDSLVVSARVIDSRETFDI